MNTQRRKLLLGLSIAAAVLLVAVLVVVVLLATRPQPQPAPQVAPNVFTEIPSIQVTAPGKYGKRARVVNVDLNLLKSGQDVTLNLFDDKKYSTHLKKLQEVSGMEVYTGAVDGGEVVLVSQGGSFYGSVRSGEDVFELKSSGLGNLMITQKDPSSYPAEEPEILPKPNPFESPLAVPLASKGTQVTSAFLSAAVVTIDVAIVYDPSVLRLLGSADAANAQAALSVAVMNQAFINSSINAQLRLVYTGLVQYDEANFNWSQTLDRLVANGDGYLDEVRAIRDNSGADVVTLLVADGGYCGLSYVLTSALLSNAPWGMNIVNYACSVDNMSYGHELMHIFGSGHDRVVGCRGMFAFSCGYLAQNYRSIEAYPAGCNGCPKRNVVSSASAVYLNAPIGDAQADNARTLGTSLVVVAQFRTTRFTHTVYLPLIAR